MRGEAKMRGKTCSRQNCGEKTTRPEGICAKCADETKRKQRSGKPNAKARRNRDVGLSQATAVDISSQSDSSDGESDSSEISAFCGKCNKLVRDCDNALCCDACKLWYHCGCIKISVETYKAMKIVESIAKWFCRKCENNVMAALAKITTLEKRVEAIEDKIEEVVCNKFDEYIREKEDREKRQDNLAIFGVPEAPVTCTNTNDRVNHDKNMIKSLHEDISEKLEIHEEDIIQVTRLGKRSDPPEGILKPRPLRIKLKDTSKKFEILKAASELKNARGRDGWKGKVFIQPDYTFNQRQLQQKVWNEFKERRANGETDIQIRNFRIVKTGTFRRNGQF